MDGENNGSKPYFLMDDLGVFPYFWKLPYFSKPDFLMDDLGGKFPPLEGHPNRWGW